MYPNYDITDEKECLKILLDMHLYSIPKYQNHFMSFIVYLISKEYCSFSIQGGIRIPIPNAIDDMKKYQDDIERFVVPYFAFKTNSKIPSTQRNHIRQIRRMMVGVGKDKDIGVVTFGSYTFLLETFISEYINMTDITHYDTPRRISAGRTRFVEALGLNIKEKPDIITEDTLTPDIVYIDASNIDSVQVSDIIDLYNPTVFEIVNHDDALLPELVKLGYVTSLTSPHNAVTLIKRERYDTIIKTIRGTRLTNTDTTLKEIKE